MAKLTISRRMERFQKKALFSFVGPGLLRAVNATARDTRDFIKQRFMGGTSTSGNRLARNTGKMEQKTVAGRAAQSTIDTKALVSINVPYASVHFGEGGKTKTTIFPRHAKALAIPLNAVKGTNHRPLLQAGSRLIKNKFTHGGLLYGRMPGKLTAPLFRMAGSVTVPVRINVERDIIPFAQDLLSKRIKVEAAKILGD